MSNENLLLEEYMHVGQKLAKKWEWLVDGIEDEYKKGTTAILLENTARKIAEDSGQLITETFETGDVTGINRIMLPIIRRVYPHLMANEFVTVQPMLTPTAQIFYLRYRMGANDEQISANLESNRKGTTQAGDEFLRVPALGSFGVNPYYSSQMVWNHPFAADESAGADAVWEGGENIDATLSLDIEWTPVLANTIKVKVVEVTEQVVPKIGNKPARTEYLYGDVVAQISFVHSGGKTPSQTSTTVDKSSTNITTFSASLSNGKISVTLKGAVPSGTMYALVADWEYNLENNPLIPEMKIAIETDYVSAKERKLKTEFTQEAMQDLKALHNIDAEAEITAVISSMLIAEIDREILNDLLVGAGIRLTHDYTGAVRNSVNFLDRNQALAAKVVDAAAMIHTYGKLGSGNFAVCNPTVAAKLESVRGYEGANSGKYEEYALGINFVGTLQGRSIKVYSDPYFPRNKILVGYKGNSFLSTAYVYAPYQPLYTTPLIYDPATLKPIKGFLTRYGKKLVVGGEYLLATIDISNLE